MTYSRGFSMVESAVWQADPSLLAARWKANSGLRERNAMPGDTLVTNKVLIGRDGVHQRGHIGL